RIPLRSGVVAVPAQPGILREKFSRWHRRRPPRQTHYLFALSRNPIYVAFWIILLGQFFVFPNWFLLVYLGAATWLFHRQVLREETYLIQHYGREYSEYCARVRRYI